MRKRASETSEHFSTKTLARTRAIQAIGLVLCSCATCIPAVASWFPFFARHTYNARIAAFPDPCCGFGSSRLMNAEPLTVDQFPGEADGHHVICPKGPVTLDNLAILRVALQFDTGNTTILDLTSVPYIDSAGLGLLMGAYVSRRKAGRMLVLTGVNRRVLSLLQITGVEPLLLIFPDLDCAIQALSTRASA